MFTCFPCSVDQTELWISSQEGENNCLKTCLGVNVCVLSVANHLRALGHVPVQVVIVRQQECVDRSFQNSKENMTNVQKGCLNLTYFCESLF